MGSLLHQELPSTVDVAVIGGGVIGAACCHSLTEAGLSTALVERREFGCGASGACEGNILVSDKRRGPEFDLVRRSIELYATIEERLEADVQLERKGSLQVAGTPHAALALERESAWMRAAGVQVELLDPTAVCMAEPILRPDISAAAFVADDLQVCPLQLVLALALASARLGAHLVQHCEVDAVELAGDRVVGLSTSRGRIGCSTVVVAAGVASRELMRGLGLELPLVGRRGQILVSAPAPGLIHHKIYDFDYRATVDTIADGVQVATVLETTRRGNVLVGASRELRENSGEPDVEVDALLAARAIELAPALSSLRILRSYAGVRPTLPDAMPAIGPVAEIGGLWLACGHEGAGIGLAPGTAELVTTAIAGDPMPVWAEAFSPGRLGRDAMGQSRRGQS